MAVARTLAQATPALDPEIPLENRDPRYVDLEPGRGSDGLATLKKLFERAAENRPLHVAFASHRGAGKSTELKRLAQQISTKYFTIYLQANVEMDAVKFSMEDMLLVVARTIEESMRQRGTPIAKSELKKVEDFFSQVVFESAEGKKYLLGVEAGAKSEAKIPFLASLLASVTASFKVESEHRESVKNQLRKYPGTLMTLVNNLLSAVTKVLEPEGLRLLVLIDNMDRYSPVVVDEFMVQSSDRFKELKCNIILTPPIELVLKAESQNVDGVFHLEIMPTVKLREKTQGYAEFSGAGRDLLLAALGKRIDLPKLIPDMQAQNRLVSSSGGAIRELLELAQDASLRADGSHITLDDVNRVLDYRRSRMRDRIDANGWWDTLAQIARTKRIDKGSDFLEVIFQRLVFQYNGEVWYDVHPLVAELLEQRQAALTATKRKTSARPAKK